MRFGLNALGNDGLRSGGVALPGAVCRCPARRPARSLAQGYALGDGTGDAVGFGVADGFGEAVGFGVADAAGDAAADGLGDGLTDPLGAADAGALAAGDATALGAADAAGASDATGFGVGIGVRKPPFPSTNAFRKISTKTAITPITKIAEARSSTWTAMSDAVWTRAGVAGSRPPRGPGPGDHLGLREPGFLSGALVVELRVRAVLVVRL